VAAIASRIAFPAPAVIGADPQLPIAARSKPVYLPSAIAHAYFTIAGGVDQHALQMAASSGDAVKLWMSGDVADRVTGLTYATVDTIRDVHDAVDVVDPSKSDLLHEFIDSLEKLLDDQIRESQDLTRRDGASA
jgi:hypothetical protein